MTVMSCSLHADEMRALLLDVNELHELKVISGDRHVDFVPKTAANDIA